MFIFIGYVVPNLESGDHGKNWHVYDASGRHYFGPSTRHACNGWIASFKRVARDQQEETVKSAKRLVFGNVLLNLRIAVENKDRGILFDGDCL